MRHDERDAAYLWDMREAGSAISGYVEGRRFVEFENDTMLRRAVEREIEIIGEAARKASQSLKAAHPEIPWSGIVAQRNVLAHEYGEIKLELIRRVATERVPELIGLLEPLIPPLPEEEDA